MKTVFIYDRDQQLPDSGWIQMCNICLSPTTSVLEEPHTYFNTLLGKMEDINIKIALCNKCKIKIKQKRYEIDYINFVSKH